MADDEQGLKGSLTIDGKTKAFARFFKKVQYFGDERGLIYYGPIDDLKIYNGKSVGLRFVDRAWEENRPHRVWVHISEEVIDGSCRKRAFLAEMAELKRAVDAKEKVTAYFVGAYPEKKNVEGRDGTTFDLYSAELSDVNHLSLTFTK